MDDNRQKKCKQIAGMDAMDAVNIQDFFNFRSPAIKYLPQPSFGRPAPELGPDKIVRCMFKKKRLNPRHYFNILRQNFSALKMAYPLMAENKPN